MSTLKLATFAVGFLRVRWLDPYFSYRISITCLTATFFQMCECIQMKLNLIMRLKTMKSIYSLTYP